jgi:glycosyltransferase involved in cell wall biosynthesis
VYGKQLRVANQLRIAMVAPPWFDVPPGKYGGIEAVLADLVDALVDRGHDVTLLGVGADLTRGRLVRTFDQPLGDRLGEPFPEVLHAARVARILDQLDVDVVHDHSLAGPLLAAGRDVPTVVTVHGPVSGELGEYYRELGSTVSLVAISDQQRRTAPDLNWRATVHNALRVDNFPFRAEKEDWVLFLGRCVHDKGMHVAIDAARASGRRIVLAAKCSEPAEKAYFDAEIVPRLGADTDWLGEVSAAEKKDLLSRAGCLLFPILWEEPFGMVMIEALACGTPVVALRRGSVPGVVIDGLTGIVCDDPRELPAALHQVSTIDPELCRKDVAERFGPEVMAAGYEAAYWAITDRSDLVA